MTEGQELYKELAREDPERTVEDSEEDDGEAKRKSLSRKMEEDSEPSDMKAAVASLFPEELGDLVANKMMVARIAPDVFIPLLRLMVTEEIMKSDPKKPISVVSTVAKFYTLLSIGLDGKGRIDLIELAGKAREDDELKELGKGLFG